MEVSRPLPDRMLGRILGDRYRVLSRLGEGGMGTVYLCEHAVLRRKFALKVLRPELSDDRELVERFRNEAIAASRIGQENVVDVVDFGAEEDGALYYVMEALEGRSLATVLREEGPLPVPRALALLEQVCRALAAAHGSGVVHRDVKPENVFIVRVEGVERAKMLDFGISHFPTVRGQERLTRAGAIIGTPEYMAPEQATGEGVDHRADVYAVGVLAYEILTGSLPIEAATPIATLVAAQTRAPEPPSRRRAGIPHEVDALVLRALAKRPEDRFPTMNELAGEIARLRIGLFGAPDLRVAAVTAKYGRHARPSFPRGETVAIPGVGDLPPTPAPIPRPRRAALLAGVATLCALIAAAAAGYWVRGEHRAVAAMPEADPNVAQAATPPAPATDDPWSVRPERSEAASAAERSRRAPTVDASLVADRAEPPAATPRAASTPSPRARRRPAAEPASGLHDPYGAGGDLKPDPFE